MDKTELRYWLDESLKRNDRTYAALVNLQQQLPDKESEAAYQEIEKVQQEVRRLLFRLRRSLAAAHKEIADV